MDDTFIAKPLGRRQIDQAYPLVRAVAPDLTIDRWRAFAASVIGPAKASKPDASKPDAAAPDAAASDGAAPHTGVMTVQNVRGYLHGLFSYVVEEHLRHGRILAVDNVVVLDLFDMTGPAETLLRAMDALARGLGCNAIHTVLPEGSTGGPEKGGSLFSCFRSEGHRAETLRMCKALDGANDNRVGPARDLRDGEAPA